jgi:hypothetical protein
LRSDRRLEALHLLALPLETTDHAALQAARVEIGRSSILRDDAAP